jgi:hypothetical protein
MTKAKVKEKDLELQKLGEPVEEPEEEVTREDIFAYIDSLNAQEQEYNINVRAPIELKLQVIQAMLNVVAVPFASLSTGVDKPYVDEDVRKEANALMLKLIKAIKIEDEEEEE